MLVRSQKARRFNRIRHERQRKSRILCCRAHPSRFYATKITVMTPTHKPIHD